MNFNQDETKKLEKEKMSKALNIFYSAFKNRTLYSADHPSFKASCQKCAPIFAEVFRSKFEFTIQHTDGIITVDDTFFIEESLMHYDFIKLLETNDIQGIMFLPGITGDEVATLLQLLLDLKNTRQDPNTPTGGIHYRIQKNQDLRELKDAITSRFNIEYIESVYDLWIMMAEKIFNRLLSDQSINVSDLVIPLDKIIELSSKEPSRLSEFISMSPINNLNLQHSVHSMIISIYLGQQIGYDITTLKSLAITSLLHDIGRFLMPSDFTTGKKLSPDSNQLVEHHCIDGASLLIGVQELPTITARAALEHHARLDGSGYPASDTSSDSHFFSKIIALSDFISWRTVSDNYYHKPISHYRLVRLLMTQAGKKFPLILVKMVLPFLGLFPSGSQVRLSDGRIGKVMRPHDKNISRPLILFPNQLTLELGSDIKTTILSLAPIE